MILESQLITKIHCLDKHCSWPWESWQLSPGLTCTYIICPWSCCHKIPIIRQNIWLESRLTLSLGVSESCFLQGDFLTRGLLLSPEQCCLLQNRFRGLASSGPQPLFSLFPASLLALVRVLKPRQTESSKLCLCVMWSLVLYTFTGTNFLFTVITGKRPPWLAKSLIQKPVRVSDAWELLLQLHYLYWS